MLGVKARGDLPCRWTLKRDTFEDTSMGEKHCFDNSGISMMYNTTNLTSTAVKPNLKLNLNIMLQFCNMFTMYRKMGKIYVNASSIKIYLTIFQQPLVVK